MKLTYYAKQCFALFFFITMSVVAQDRSIQGTVTDDAGVPLPGATVVILETNQGTTTDFDGNYSINVTDGQTLAISCRCSCSLTRIKWTRQKQHKTLVG